MIGIMVVSHEPLGTAHAKRPAELVPLQERPSTYGVVLGAQDGPLDQRVIRS